MTDETIQSPEPNGEAPPEANKDLGAVVQSLQVELGDAKAKSAEYLDGWQRARAEFANYKKRQERDQSDQYHSLLARVLNRYLEISDDLERALKAKPAEGEGAVWAEGIAAIQRKLLGFLDFNFSGAGLINGDRLHTRLETKLRGKAIEDLPRRSCISRAAEPHRTDTHLLLRPESQRWREPC